MATETLPNQSPSTPAASRVLDRITVVEDIYHQSIDDEPFHVRSTYSRELSTKEQPYERKLSLKQLWTNLDTGWVENVGLVHISNDEGRYQQVVPTAAEKKEVSERVLEVGILHDGKILTVCTIPPGESMRFVPADASNIMIHSLSESARITLRVFPA